MRVKLETATKKQKEASLAYAMKWLKEEAMPKVTRNVEAIILWQLHEQYGFGKKRIQKFLAETAPMIMEMLDEYNWNADEDAIWLCEYKLKKELGIDLSKLDSPFSSEINLEK